MKNKAGGVGRDDLMEGPTNLIKNFGFYPGSFPEKQESCLSEKLREVSFEKHH